MPSASKPPASAHPTAFLVVHDNKAPGLPRLAEIRLAPSRRVFTLHAFECDDVLASAADLEAIFEVPRVGKACRGGASEENAEKKLYGAVQSNGLLYVIDVDAEARAARTFEPPHQLRPPRRFVGSRFNIEGARVYKDPDAPAYYLEYANRGGGAEGGEAWVARVAWDVRRARPFGPPSLSHIVAPLADDSRARQVSDLGTRSYGKDPKTRFARYGNLDAAAYDDEQHERDFRSYLYVRYDPTTSTGRAGGERVVVEPQIRFVVPGHKIEAVTELSPHKALYITDDEGRGSVAVILDKRDGGLGVMHWDAQRSSGYGEDADPRLAGISGVASLS